MFDAGCGEAIGRFVACLNRVSKQILHYIGMVYILNIRRFDDRGRLQAWKAKRCLYGASSVRERPNERINMGRRVGFKLKPASDFGRLIIRGDINPLQWCSLIRLRANHTFQLLRLVTSFDKV